MFDFLVQDCWLTREQRCYREITYSLTSVPPATKWQWRRQMSAISAQYKQTQQTTGTGGGQWHPHWRQLRSSAACRCQPDSCRW